MLTFAEYIAEDTMLLEVFNQTYDYHWEKQSVDWIAKFKDSEGKTVRVTFARELGGFDRYLLYFFRRNANDVISAGKTGQGDAYKVFATVMKIAGEFVKEVEPKRVSFSASKDPDDAESSRSRLYDTMVKKFASEGYSIKTNTEMHQKDWFFNRV